MAYCWDWETGGLVGKNHPRQVVKTLNQYFSEMTLAVKEHKGLILQYVGNEIKLVFGAPVGFDDHPEMAVPAGNIGSKERMSS